MDPVILDIVVRDAHLFSERSPVELKVQLEFDRELHKAELPAKAKTTL